MSINNRVYKGIGNYVGGTYKPMEDEVISYRILSVLSNGRGLPFSVHNFVSVAAKNQQKYA